MKKYVKLYEEMNEIEQQNSLDFDKQTYTRQEVINMLEDVYMETAGSYNDYGKNSDDYKNAAISYVKTFMENK